ncbi:unnamed protein product [Jaminaea pallidilutea]
MSILSDPDYTIWKLRSSYLRRIDDNYGPRIISLANTGHGLHVELARPHQPQPLTTPYSPVPGASTLPQRGLDYSKTIYGPGRSSARATPRAPPPASIRPPDTAPVRPPRSRRTSSGSVSSSSSASSASLDETGEPDERAPVVDTSIPPAASRSKTAVQPRQGALDITTKRLRPQRQTGPSALAQLLSRQHIAPSNPFAQLYAGVAGSGAAAGSMGVDMYFPWSAESSKPLHLDVRKDATMEELIGYSLFCYVEANRQPSIEQTLSSATAADPAIDAATTIPWALRIVEDGEVDDDYPSLDRNLIVGRFGGDEFAVCQASATQIRQHQQQAAVISASRRPVAPQSAASATASASVLRSQVQQSQLQAPQQTSQSLQAASAAGLSASLNRAPTIFLRILITPNDQVRYKTTLSVPSDMYLADVLELVCRKRNLGSPDDWALVVAAADDVRSPALPTAASRIVVPLDRTVESLQGSHDLVLVRRSTLGAQGVTSALAGQSTNPNASIFRTVAEQSTGTGSDARPRMAPSGLRGTAAGVPSSVYKSWTVTVNRKVMQPMFSTASQRTLTIDGDWIHIVPVDSRAFHTHAASFAISDVAVCKQSSKVQSHFKLHVVVKLPTGSSHEKRYEFEAEDARQAGEIVTEVVRRKRSSRRP